MIKIKIQCRTEIRQFLLLSSALLMISVLLASLTISNYNIPPIESQDDNIQNLKSANSWILSPFIIDNSGGGDYTWAEAALEEWCSGSGTWNDPYLIENVSINGFYISTCLEIRNSFNIPFSVKNCTFYNSGFSYHGIRLDNARNGKIINSNALNCQYGILLFLQYQHFSHQYMIHQRLRFHPKRYLLFLQS